jgi:hypothetical protein
MKDIRLFVTPRMHTSFMQLADVFNKNKVLYKELDFSDLVDSSISEHEFSVLAKAMFGENLIFISYGDSPMLINPNVQTISDGKGWCRLIDALEKLFPKIEFEHDDRFMNIKIKQEET